MSDRQAWILTNWPYVVERHELDRLDSPTPRPRDTAEVAVHELLDRLAQAIPPPSPSKPEPRSLAELAATRTNLDPGRHLRELTTELVTIGDRLAHLEHEPAPAAASLPQLVAENLRGRRAALRA